MASDERSAEVQIFGERYTLRATESPEYLQRVADYVDGKFYEVAKGSPGILPSKVGVLASLNIADELFKREETARRLEREALARIDGIVQLFHR